MSNQQREASYESPLEPTPYADPRTILSANGINSSNNQVSAVVPQPTILEKCFASFLFIVFVSYMIFQIILAGFNCPLPDSNLGWIRASFFLNIPYVFFLLIYIIQRIITKKFSSLNDFRNTFLVYISYFTLYELVLGISFEAGELHTIRKILSNATAINMLPCSTAYYENIFRLKISQYCLFFLFIVFSCCCYCIIAPWKGTTFISQRCHQLSLFINNRWRYFIETICQRHHGEILIEQY
jgi:hypothetical protein